MAVPEGKRSQSTFEVQTKAKELASYTLTICSNEKVFPKRHRWSLTSRIVSITLSIMENIDFANSIYVSTKEDFVLRRNAQTTALGDISKLLGLIDLAYRQFDIEGSRISYWASLVTNVQELLRAWRNADLKRFNEYRG